MEKGAKVEEREGRASSESWPRREERADEGRKVVRPFQYPSPSIEKRDPLSCESEGEEREKERANVEEEEKKKEGGKEERE